MASSSPLRALVVAAVVVALLHVLGGALFFVRILELPLVWLSTFAHETGHGLAAIAVGGRFESLVLHWDGSGVARHTGDLSAVARAIVSAGGLVGPAVVAALCFVLGTRPRLARVGIALFGVVMLVVAALFVRNAFGVVFTVAMGALLVGGAVKLSDARAQVAMLFLAIQLALSVFSGSDYLFTDTAKTASGDMPSDVAHIAQALGGTYWLWGLAVAALSVVILAGGLGGVWLADRLHERKARRAPR